MLSNDHSLEFLGVKPSASQDDIARAYRKRSRVIHPDKAKQSLIASRAKPTSKSKLDSRKVNPGVHVSKPPSDTDIRDAIKKASDRFARLAVITTILKGSGRERYDHFLSNGFPKWKGTGYYYARFRPGLGSVLIGLFVLGGGLAHYGAMYVSWMRQREFVERYIRHARRTAWGDESLGRGIPGVDAAEVATSAAASQEDVGLSLNRRQKRQQDRESKKEKDVKITRGVRQRGTRMALESESDAGPQGAKKKVQAENGKVLIVDSVGNVFLEQEGDDGTKGEYLLDPEEVMKPTFRDTVLFRLPLWAYVNVKNRALGTSDAEDGDVEDKSTSGEESGDVASEVKRATIGTARKIGRRNGMAH